MDRRIHKVIRILPDLIFPPSRNSEATDNYGKRKRDKLLLERAAKEVGLEPSSLRQLFSAEMNVPFKRYVDKLRMEKARAMAENTTLNVTEIMNEIGIDDHRSFRRKLNKIYGQTLSKLRKSLDKQAEKDSSREVSGPK